jgi:hypothetical protein
MRTLHSDLKHLLNIFRFASGDAAHASLYKTGPERTLDYVAP